jgi:hypothetical protein
MTIPQKIRVYESLRRRNPEELWDVLIKDSRRPTIELGQLLQRCSQLPEDVLETRLQELHGIP